MNVEAYTDGKIFLVITDKSVYCFSKKTLYKKLSTKIQEDIDKGKFKFLDKFRKVWNEKIIIKIISLLGERMTS